jgi:replicative DNA helicase
MYNTEPFELPAEAGHEISEPHSIETEQALLGALLLASQSYVKVAGVVEPGHFFEPLHGRLYAVIGDLAGKGLPVTPLTLEPYFGDEKVGPLSVRQYLGRLAASATTIVNAPHYARHVADLSRRRRMAAIGAMIMGRAQSDFAAGVDVQIADAESHLSAILGELPAKRDFTAGQAARLALDRIAAAYAHGGVSGLATGFTDLDLLLGGLQSSDLIILAGRPSMGKTALAMGMAFHIAKSIDAGEVSVYSLEMSAAQLLLRQLSVDHGIEAGRLRRGSLAQQDMERLIRSERDYDNIRLHIDETGGLTLSALNAKARRRKQLHGTVCLVVDYLQIMGGAGNSKYANRVQEITAITSGLKALAKALDIPVIALSQLSRQVENREDKRPQLSDLRDSGSIEQDADAVLFVFREEYYLARREPPVSKTQAHLEWRDEIEAVKGVAEIIVAKHRHGPIGTVQLSFHAPLARFSNLYDMNEGQS